MSDRPTFAVHPETGDFVNVESPEWARVLRDHPPPYLVGVVPAGHGHGYALYSLQSERLLVAQHADLLDDVLGQIRSLASTPLAPRVLSDGMWALRDVAGVVVYDAREEARAHAPEEVATTIAHQTEAVLGLTEALHLPAKTVPPRDWAEDWDAATFYERTGYGINPDGEMVTPELAVMAGRLVYGLTYGDLAGDR